MLKKPPADRPGSAETFDRFAVRPNVKKMCLKSRSGLPISVKARWDAGRNMPQMKATRIDCIHKNLIKASVARPAASRENRPIDPPAAQNGAPSHQTAVVPATVYDQSPKLLNAPRKRARRPVVVSEVAAIVERGGRYLTVPEVAAYLVITESCMRNWAVAGKGPKRTIVGTRAVRFRPEDVRSYIRS